MILYEYEIEIMNQIELFKKEYDLLGKYSQYHLHIFEQGLSYLPIQYLPNNTFGFSFRIATDKIYLQLVYSNKNRKFYKGDKVKFVFDRSEIEFKLISGSIKDENSLNIAVEILSPEEYKSFLFDNLISIEITSKRNEITFIHSDLNHTLEYLKVSDNLYQSVIKKTASEILVEFLKTRKDSEFSRLKND